MERAEKNSIIEDLSGRFNRAQITICADYRGLTVAQITKLRKDLHGAGFRGAVVKNTLAGISAKRGLAAAKDGELDKFLDLFKGPSFVVFSDEDPIKPAKLAKDFAESNEKFQIKGAWFENGFVDAAGVKTLASLPSREENLAKLLSLMNAPATQLVQMLQAPGAQLVRLLAAYKDKLEKAA